MRDRWSFLWKYCGALLVLAGCGAPAPQAGSCVTGQTVACACRGGGVGAQVCNVRGTFNPCDCEGTTNTMLGQTGSDAAVGSDAVEQRVDSATTPPPTPPAGGCSVRFDEGTGFVDTCASPSICRCPRGITCENEGECVPALPRDYGVLVLHAQLMNRRMNGTPWDGNNSNPDLATVVMVDEQVIGASETRFDTLSVDGSPYFATRARFQERSILDIAVVDVDGDVSMQQYEIAVACRFGPVDVARMRSRMVVCETPTGSVNALVDPL